MNIQSSDSQTKNLNPNETRSAPQRNGALARHGA